MLTTYQYCTESLERAYLITWVTHNSRINKHMTEIGIKELNPLILSEDEQKIITEIITEKVIQNNLIITAYSILKDHIHLIIITKETMLRKVIHDLKGYSSYMFFKKSGLSKEGKGEQNILWAKHYNISFLNTEEKYNNAIEYVKNNKIKHTEKDKNAVKILK